MYSYCLCVIFRVQNYTVWLFLLIHKIQIDAPIWANSTASEALRTNFTESPTYFTEWVAKLNWLWE